MSAKDMFELVDYSTDDWGGVAPYDRQPEREGNDQVFVHWPGYQIRQAASDGNVNSEKATLRDIEASAMKRNWWGIQYDVIVGQSGTVYAGRLLARSGATSGDVDDDGTHNNTEGEAVLCLLSPDDIPSDEMLASLKRLLEAHGGDVYGHKDAKGTKTPCPGDVLLDWIARFNAGELDTDGPSGGLSEDRSTYTVQKGDTLTRIAQVTSTAVKTIVELNGIEDPDHIEVGQVLALTGEAEKPEPAPVRKTTSSTTTKKTSHWTEDVMAKLETLKKGSRGVQVKRAQAMLNSTGQHSLKVDGLFGLKTERAVYEYQEDRRLDRDGIIGKQTWSALLTRE